MSTPNGLSPEGYWTTKDIRILTDLWGHAHYRDIAIKLKRSPAGLIKQAGKLGLISGRQHLRTIDTQKIKLLLLRGNTSLEISIELGCTKRRINQIITNDLPEYAALRDAIGKLRIKRGKV